MVRGSLRKNPSVGGGVRVPLRSLVVEYSGTGVDGRLKDVLVFRWKAEREEEDELRLASVRAPSRV